MRFYLAAIAAVSASAQLAAAPVVVAPAPPAAAAAVHASKADAATVAAAVQLLDGDGFDAQMMHSTDLMVGVSIAGMTDGLRKQFGDGLPNDFLDELRTTMHDHAMATMRARLPDMKRQVAEIYAEEFTRDELIHLRELHSDPVAVKARERGKEIEPKLMIIGVRTMQAAQPELEAQIKRLVTDYLAAHDKSGGSSS